MRKLSVWIFLLFSICVMAQEVQEYHLTTRSWQVGLGGISLKDAYLSPLVYTGNGLQYKSSDRRFLFKDSDKFTSITTGALSFYGLSNPKNTASMMYFDVYSDYAIHYHFRFKERFQLLIGGSWDIDLGFKYLSRNVNNPFNLDLSTNLNVSALFLWKIPTRKRVMQLETRIYSPFLGAMFAPENGATYYEMFTLENGLKNTGHISSLGNKAGYKFNAAFDIPFKNWTLRLAYNNEMLQYKANNAVYHRYFSGISIGTRYEFYKFKGRKNLPPSNFLSPND